ncbi:MAG: hypothetical protein KKC68_07760 [Candidatus Thermoplasmatota archaeon]|nr:hypothetical protein [Candidatus Thermoplasmatota archaeon]MBU1941653.1 hypothetical protein [Candidatus Thermoplasmatota archaeon]
MALFQMCPVCGEAAFVQPELGNGESRIFRCSNDHQFKQTNKESVNTVDEEVWNHLPEWAQQLHALKDK